MQLTQSQALVESANLIDAIRFADTSLFVHGTHPTWVPTVTYGENALQNTTEAYRFSLEHFTLSPTLESHQIQLDGLTNTTLTRFGLSDRLCGAFWVRQLQQVVWHIRNLSDKQVVGCAAAPAARGTPIEFELKSLVVETKERRYVVHLPATRRLSFNKLKAVLQTNKLNLASIDHLPSPPGKICALAEPISSLPCVVCESLLEKLVVTTNDTTIHGFFLFPPIVLMALRDVRIAPISHEVDVAVY